MYVDTHNIMNQTHYYRWDYAETWEYTTPWVSLYEWKAPGIITARAQPIHHCWGMEKASTIEINSTTKLSQDVVSDYPLRLLPATAYYKLYEKYSIIVQQYAQTQEEYNYWLTLKKNTESIGTLFDPLPTQLAGNIHSASLSNETVIGYIGVHNVSEKRIFIKRDEIPKTVRLANGYDNCTKLDTVKNELTLPGILNAGFGLIIDISPYTVATQDCADCRARGGVLQKPTFWK